MFLHLLVYAEIDQTDLLDFIFDAIDVGKSALNTYGRAYLCGKERLNNNYHNSHVSVWLCIRYSIIISINEIECMVFISQRSICQILN